MTSDTGKSCVVLFSGLWWCGQAAKWLAGKMKAQKISKKFIKPLRVVTLFRVSIMTNLNLDLTI